MEVDLTNKEVGEYLFDLQKYAIMHKQKLIDTLAGGGE